jgi:hypothetical protein
MSIAVTLAAFQKLSKNFPKTFQKLSKKLSKNFGLFG